MKNSGRGLNPFFFNKPAFFNEKDKLIKRQNILYCRMCGDCLPPLSSPNTTKCPACWEQKKDKK